MTKKAWAGSRADLDLMRRLGERYKSIPGSHYDNYLKLCLGLTIDALAREFMRPEVYKRIDDKYAKRRIKAET